MRRILHFSARAIRAVFITFVLLFLALAIFLNSNYFDEFLKKQIETRLPGAIKRTVTVDSVAFNPFLLSVNLKNLTVGNDPRGSPSTPFFRANEIYVRVSWRYLFGGKVRISEVRLDHPELFVEFYPGGGNNWPTTGPKKEKKKGGLDLIVKQVDCDNMTVIVNQRRIPVTFSVKDLETFVEYDNKQNNYLASTSFRDGRLKITHFEVWEFDLKSTYRIIGGRVSFERLFLLTPQSKFYFAGDMYNLSNPFFDFRFRSHINLNQTKKIFQLGPVMSGGGTFRAVYKGTFTNFRMQGTGNFRNFIFYSLPIDSATFDLDMTDNWLNVTNINAHMFDGGYKGEFAIAPLKGTSVFKTKAELKDWDGRRLGQFVKMKDLVIPIKGSGTASLVWEENGFKDLKGDFAFKMEPAEPMQHDLASVAENSKFDKDLYKTVYVLPVTSETEFHIEGRQLRNLHSHLRTPYTDLDLNGTIDFSGEAALDVVSHTEKIPEVDLLFHYLRAYFKNERSETQDFWAVKGAADFNGKLDSTVWSPFEPRLTGEIHGRNTTFHGVNLSAVRADVLFYGKRIEIYDSDLKSGDATGSAKATFLLEDKERRIPDSMELNGAVTNFPAEKIAGAFYMDLPVRGAVNATIQLHGPLDELEGRADFDATRGEMWGEKWDTGSGTVLFFADSLGLRDITARVGAGYAQASGDLVYDSDDYNVEFAAENIPLEKLTFLKQASLEIYGLGSARGNGHGTLDKPQLQADLNIRDLVYKKEAYGEVKSTGELKDGWIRIDTSGISRGVTSTAHGELHLDGELPFKTNFNIEKFPIEILTRAYAPGTTGLTGLVGGKFDMNGRLKPAQIDHLAGFLDRIQVNWSGLKFEQARPLNVQLSDQVIVINDSLLVGSHSSFSVTGRIFPSDDWRLDLNLQADAGLEMLGDMNKDITASGVASARIAIGGSMENPTLTGVAEIKNGFFRHYSFPNSLTDINALFTFKNRNVTLQSLKASSSGGTLTAGGSATIKGYDLDTYRFDLYADKIRVHYPEGLRSTVTSELHLQADRNTSYLVGDINVLQGVYARSFEETPDLFGYARVPTFAGLAGAPAAERPLQLNIRIHSDGDLLVRNNFANIESFGELNLIGTMDNPVLVGRMEVRKGDITFRDRQYHVVRGALDFQNPYRTEAQLNFVAQTKVREYNITLNFNGTFDRVYHDLSSDPPLPKDDIYALLGIGNTRDAFQGTADVSTLIAGQQISEFITSPITSPLEREFKKVFGLQRFQIDPTYVRSTNVATARITLQKDISRDFSVTYSTNVFTTAEEIILLQYQLKNDIQITASKDELDRYGVDILVTKSFE